MALYDIFRGSDVYNAITENKDETVKEYGIDFDTGQLTGSVVFGFEAIKVWAWLALNTERYQYPIYPWDYGSEYYELIGQKYSAAYTTSLTRQMTEDCLKVNPHIKGINDFTCQKDGDKLLISFSLVTDMGEGELKINV
jgi:hypothetical protein